MFKFCVIFLGLDMFADTSRATMFRPRFHAPSISHTLDEILL